MFLWSQKNKKNLDFVIFINPFHATGLFLYPTKTLENQVFSDVFRGYIKRPVAWKHEMG